jgi:hypothetical protein
MNKTAGIVVAVFGSIVGGIALIMVSRQVMVKNQNQLLFEKFCENNNIVPDGTYNKFFEIHTTSRMYYLKNDIIQCLNDKLSFNSDSETISVDNPFFFTIRHESGYQSIGTFNRDIFNN